MPISNVFGGLPASVVNTCLFTCNECYHKESYDYRLHFPHPRHYRRQRQYRHCTHRCRRHRLLKEQDSFLLLADRHCMILWDKFPDRIFANITI